MKCELRPTPQTCSRGQCVATTDAHALTPVMVSVQGAKQSRLPVSRSISGYRHPDKRAEQPPLHQKPARQQTQVSTALRMQLRRSPLTRLGARSIRRLY
jgi:hypothetical protein